MALNPQDQLNKLMNFADDPGLAIFDELQVINDNLNEVKNLNLADVSVLQGEQGIQGEKGDPGTNGIDGKDGQNGKNGKNGTNGVDGKDGVNGLDGADGKDGSPDTALDIKAKLLSLSEEDKLKLKDFGGFDNLIKMIEQTGKAKSINNYLPYSGITTTFFSLNGADKGRAKNINFQSGSTLNVTLAGDTATITIPTGGGGGGTIGGSVDPTQIAYGGSTPDTLTSDADATRIVGTLTNISDSFAAGQTSAIKLSPDILGIGIKGAGLTQNTANGIGAVVAGDFSALGSSDFTVGMASFDADGLGLAEILADGSTVGGRITLGYGVAGTGGTAMHVTQDGVDITNFSGDEIFKTDFNNNSVIVGANGYGNNTTITVSDDAKTITGFANLATNIDGIMMIGPLLVPNLSFTFSGVFNSVTNNFTADQALVGVGDLTSIGGSTQAGILMHVDAAGNVASYFADDLAGVPIIQAQAYLGASPAAGQSYTITPTRTDIGNFGAGGNSTLVTIDDGIGQIIRSGGIVDTRVESVAYGGTTNITLLQYDFIIGTSGSGATTLNLPTGTNARVGTIYIFDDFGNANSTNQITIDAGGGNTIHTSAGIAQTYDPTGNGWSLTLKKVTATAWMAE